jgi:hypothetical protein
MLAVESKSDAAEVIGDAVRDRIELFASAGPASGFQEPLPFAIVHFVPEFVWGISAQSSKCQTRFSFPGKSIPQALADEI